MKEVSKRKYLISQRIINIFREHFNSRKLNGEICRRKGDYLKFNRYNGCILRLYNFEIFHLNTCISELYILCKSNIKILIIFLSYVTLLIKMGKSDALK